MSKGSFLNASIGRKFLMSITGLFLIMFLMVHMSINLLLIFDDSGDLYNIEEEIGKILGDNIMRVFQQVRTNRKIP